MARPVTANTRLLEATEGRTQIPRKRCIDPECSGVDPLLEGLRPGQAAGPAVPHESIAAVVGDRQCVVVVIKNLNADNWAKHFLLAQRQLIAIHLKNGGCNKITVSQISARLPSTKQRGALRFRALDMIQHAVPMRFERHGADLGLCGQRITDDQSFGSGDEVLHEALCNASLHEDARPCDADLATVAENVDQRTVYGPLHIGVIKHDVRRLAAQFEVHGCEVSRGRRHDLSRGVTAPCKRNTINILRTRERGTGNGAAPINDVDCAGWQTSLFHQCDEFQYGKRREF